MAAGESNGAGAGGKGCGHLVPDHVGDFVHREVLHGARELLC